MRTYIYIGAGGFLGAILRYVIKNIIIINYKGNFPINTLFINITGCFILALFLSLTAETIKVDKDIKLAVSIGFLGAYTTFSTFCKENAILIAGGNYHTVIFYVSLSILFGLASVFLGGFISKKVSQKIIGKRELLEIDFDEETSSVEITGGNE